MSLKQLRELAEAATPGPRIECGPSYGAPLPTFYNAVAVDGSPDDDDTVDICNDTTHEDAQFIAFYQAAHADGQRVMRERAARIPAGSHDEMLILSLEITNE